MGGLFFATILTVLAVPALYVAWYRISPVDQIELRNPQL